MAQVTWDHLRITRLLFQRVPVYHNEDGFTLRIAGSDSQVCWPGVCERQEHPDNNTHPSQQRQARGSEILHQPDLMKTPETFSSPASSDMHLASLNPHERDHRIEFSEDTHTYTLDQAKVFPISVTGVWSKFFEKFDPQETVDKYFPKWVDDPDSKYFQQIHEDLASGIDEQMIKGRIIAEWEKAGQTASANGTFVHRQIELFLNRQDYCPDGEEFEQFGRFLKEFATPRGCVSK